MFFQSWAHFGRAILFVLIGYAVVVLIVRVAGKRTLSSLNMLDLIVVIAVGNLLAMGVLSPDAPLVDTLAAIATLVGMEFASDWLSVRFRLARRAFNARPTLVVWQGRLLSEALRRERVSEDEVRAAVRLRGHASLAQVRAVVIEATGEMSVIVGEGGREELLAELKD